MKKKRILCWAAIVILTCAHSQAQQKRQAVPVNKAQVSRSHPATTRQLLSPHAVNKPAVQSSGTQKALNPQPLPPKAANKNVIQSSGAQKALNPQPLPPKAGKTKIKKQTKAKLK